jgi:hypothetical protein
LACSPIIPRQPDNKETNDKLDKLIDLLGKAKEIKESDSLADKILIGLTAFGVTTPFGMTGLGGLALTGIIWLVRRKIKKRFTPQPSLNTDVSSLQNQLNTLREDMGRIETGARPGDSFPEPAQLPTRRMDELNELLRLGRLEGRDPLLDAAFGMFAQDEIARSVDSADNDAEAYRRLRVIVKDRIDSVAPLEIKSNG